MSIFSRTPPAAEPAATPPAEPVSRAEFDDKFSKMMGAIQDLAQRPVVVHQNQPAAPPPPEITDEEINEALASGNGASRVKEMVRRQLDVARGEVAREVGAVREHGAASLGALAEKTFVIGLDTDDRAIFGRYEDEIKNLVNQCEPALRGMPQTWEACFATVAGAHRKELESEWKEAALRQRAEDETRAAAPQPGRAGGRAPVNDDGEIPTIADFVGTDQRFEGVTEEEFIRKINRGKPAGEKYKDWADYNTRGKAIEKQLRALATGDEEAAA